MEKRPWSKDKPEVVGRVTGRVTAQDENGITVEFGDDPDDVIESLLSMMSEESVPKMSDERDDRKFWVPDRKVYKVDGFSIGMARVEGVDGNAVPAMRLSVRRATLGNPKQEDLHLVFADASGAGNLGINLLGACIPEEVMDEILAVLNAHGITSEVEKR